jgi:hypothetical protein
VIEQTEAERQAIEKADRDKAAAEERTVEADAAMNRLLRGEPSKEQVEQQRGIKEKTRRRLEAIAVDESEDEETRLWAQGVLDGKTDINGDPINKRKPKSADGGAGSGGDHLQWDPFRPKTLTEQARDALLDKRYGQRHTQNHLLPGPGSGE